MTDAALKAGVEVFDGPAFHLRRHLELASRARPQLLRRREFGVEGAEPPLQLPRALSQEPLQPHRGTASRKRQLRRGEFRDHTEGVACFAGARAREGIDEHLGKREGLHPAAYLRGRLRETGHGGWGSLEFKLRRLDRVRTSVISTN